MKTVPQLLHDAADLFESRNREYGDAYKRFGAVLAAMFPEGIGLHCGEDFGRFALFVMNLGKFHRYANNFTAGGHAGSTEDMMVYSAMLHEYDASISDAAEPFGCECGQDVPVAATSAPQDLGDIPF